jgi:hypothetical protein
MENNIEVKPSSIYPNEDYEKVELNQLAMPTWFLLVFLIVCFFILKSFVYTKDDKRHGK